MTSQLNDNNPGTQDADRLTSLQLQLQMDALKAHINMHFLFNNLNTLASLIDEDQGLSKEFLQKFSTVYQYLLCLQHKKIIPVEVEMNFIADYFFLCKIRFGKNIDLDVQLPATMQGFGIAPLTILTLLENAIKHNVISEQDPLNISVYVLDGKVIEETLSNQHPLALGVRIRLENQFIVVENTLNPRPKAAPGGQTGLTHLMALYLELTSTLPVIEKTDNYFRVKIP